VQLQYAVFVGSLLDSNYSFIADLINGTYACSNDETLNSILKGQLGFRGYVQSDWQVLLLDFTTVSTI
jgi:hypothetical protein